MSDSGFLRNLLCFLGFHKWACEDRSRREADGSITVTTYNRCLNERCRYHPWMPMNIDKMWRKPW